MRWYDSAKLFRLVDLAHATGTDLLQEEERPQLPRGCGLLLLVPGQGGLPGGVEWAVRCWTSSSPASNLRLFGPVEVRCELRRGDPGEGTGTTARPSCYPRAEGRANI